MYTFDLLKKLFPHIFRGIVGGLMAGLLLTGASDTVNTTNNTSKPVTVENHYATETEIHEASESVGTVEFKATLVNKDNKLLKDHKVAIYDITDGRDLVEDKLSNEMGEATFTGLKTDRSYNVVIDGEESPYTFRNSDSSTMGRVFILDAEADQDADSKVSDKLATVRTNSEDNELLGQVTVALYYNGEKVAETLSDYQGLATFNNLQDGVFYDIYVNGQASKNFVRTGELTDVYLAGTSTEYVLNDIPGSN